MELPDRELNELPRRRDGLTEVDLEATEKLCGIVLRVASAPAGHRAVSADCAGIGAAGFDRDELSGRRFEMSGGLDRAAIARRRAIVTPALDAMV